MTSLRSIKPLLTASNYRVRFRLKTLFLEIKFLLKMVYEVVSRKKIKEERFLGYRVTFPSFMDFFCLFVEIFGIQEYKFISSKESPFIIDCGSNWGMSIIYFKYFYPHARIIAIEANKNTVEYLKNNIKLNNFSGITVYNAVLAEQEGIHPFFINNKNDGWSLSDTGVTNAVSSRSDFSQVMVKTIQLSKLLTQKIDLLKLDIEGMEGEVLHEARHKLHIINEIILEYHGSMNTSKYLFNTITSLLKKSGFVYIISSGKNLIPQSLSNGLRIIQAVNRNNIT